MNLLIHFQEFLKMLYWLFTKKAWKSSFKCLKRIKTIWKLLHHFYLLVILVFGEYFKFLRFFSPKINEVVDEKSTLSFLQVSYLTYIERRENIKFNILPKSNEPIININML